MPEGEGNQNQGQNQSQNQSQRSGRGGSRGGSRGGRGRGGRGRGRGGGGGRGGRSATSSSQPQPQPEASVPAPTADAQSSSAPDNSGHSRGRRNRRGPRRGGRQPETEAQAPNSWRTGTQRRFGGQLTTSDADDAASSTSAGAPALSAQAREFVPGQPLVLESTDAQSTQGAPQSQPASQPQQSTRSRPRRKARRPKTDGPTAPKSTKAELWERIHEDIANFNYECRICTEEVTRKSQVWSCNICWSVVHLQCAQEWYATSQKTTENDGVIWRCPGCNSDVTEDPSAYSCWCGKEINPTNIGMLPPHSCGQTCSKPRTTCHHPCPLQCHAGPCPTCDVLSPPEPCYCGKLESRLRCKDTDITNGWSCKEVCGDLLPCGEHECEELCHPGVCKPCEVPVTARCYCGKAEKEMLCFERFESGEPQDSYSLTTKDWFVGYFDCGETCERAYDCKVHLCSIACHPQVELPAHCPFSPDVVSTCPCGKTSLESLLDHVRESCEDKIPNCARKCEKRLSCNHFCDSTCHAGDCPPCSQIMDIDCRCGRVTATSACHQGDIQHPWCTKVCQATKNCGRHRCGEHCCPGEKKAQMRVAQQKKHRRAVDQLPVEDEHICLQICARPLTCGNHLCERVCHRGPCLSCPEAVWVEISCHCGDTVLEPGQPCGTRPPACNSKCRRQTACGHPPVDHKCHPDEVECPPCPYIKAKPCNCGKETLPWVPCHVQRPHCGEPCGRKLKCGLHTCRKVCHRPDECRDSDQDCQQVCGRTKVNCEHTCQNPCHGSTPCQESTACQVKKLVTCPCGNVKKEVKCLASSSNPNPEFPVKCTDVCERLDRNKRLAEALNINPDTHTNDHVPYSDATLKLYKEMTTLGDNKEREYRVLCNDPVQVRLRYEPMQNRTRQFLHLLAEDFGLKSQSEDYGNDRHVLVWKTVPVVTPPAKTLAQCVEIRARQANQAAVAKAIAPPSSPPPGTQPFNGFVLTTPRFGITIDEIVAAFDADFATLPAITFKAEYLSHFETHDEVLVTAKARFSAFLTPAPVEKSLVDLRSNLETTMHREKLAGGLLLCHADNSGTITRRETRRQTGAGGWSAVASKAAKGVPAPAGEKPVARKLVGLLRKKKSQPETGKTWDALEGDIEC